ncbi:hypothetical protein OUZ56_022214 [Daphnia magna]|uniref:Uncharacterized protein n=1 Tax=Daphnia magna TaxID=35525 RepID=A0ABR0AVP2_9CRUS|nr:hypothetical protein OUZ56_022214 [Daphnia magna]
MVPTAICVPTLPIPTEESNLTSDNGIPVKLQGVTKLRLSFKISYVPCNVNSRIASPAIIFSRLATTSKRESKISQDFLLMSTLELRQNNE